MFTGIITDVGEVVAREEARDTRFTIACGYDPASIAIGASIACAGCCLTAVATGRHADGRGVFMVEASAETLGKTTLDPRTRTLLRVQVDSLLDADQTFVKLLGKDPNSRYEFIMSHADQAAVEDLDV